MLFPEIPESLAGMSAADLKALKASYRTALKAFAASDEYTLADGQAHLATLQSLADAEAVAESREAIDALADDEVEEDDEDEVEEEADEEASTDEVEVEEVEVVAAAKAPAIPKKVRTTTGAAAGAADITKYATPSHVVAQDGSGKVFGSWTEVAQALVDKAENLSGAGEKFPVGAIHGDFPKERQLTADPVFNLKMFDEAELTAACDPVEPTYRLGCLNATNRPVAASLASFRPERAGISVYPSPTLNDVVGQGKGVGIWTFADDANPSATKQCATVQCGTPTEFRWYGIYRCLTVQNMVQMVLPELVEAYLNRLTAWYARTAEVQLLEAMGARASTITAPALGYGGATSITTTLLNYLALYQEQQRWDVGEMDAWLPRWVLYAVKIDLARRARFDGGTNLVASDAEVNRVFNDAGVTPHFFRDQPSWATPIPRLQVTGVLGQLPRNVDMLVAPRGKFVMMDRGQLSIGVSGTSPIRDISSLMGNDFTMFFENFEGVADMNSCPAHLIQIPNVCWNGQQIAQVAIDCEGQDYLGVAS